MFCTKCGNQCEDGQRFCNNCGAQLEAAPAAEEPVAEAPVIEEPVIEEPAAEAVEETAEEVSGAVEEAAEAAKETAMDEPVSLQPPFAAPEAEQPYSGYPVYQPPMQQEYSAPAAAPVTLKKKSGVGKWIARIVISCLPLLLTYLALFVSGIIWPGSLLPMNPNLVLSSWAPEARTIAIVILAVICASVLLQIICLAVWALRKKGDPALRDWAVGFTVVALAVVVAAILFSLGMMLFNDNYPRLFSFLEGYVAPVRYIGLLISVL
ncbi:MAG: zinc ribbon domain-containing protein [Clostridia bacterium]|nr:zinc ribbon domain-containing protein [Clostridia bacterium]